MKINALDRVDISYLEKILIDEEGNLKVVPYSDIKDVPQSHISQFCVIHGVYSVATIELIELLANEINGEQLETIEIGAGNGVTGKALGITCTDSFMQNRPDVQLHYNLFNQATVKYGTHVRHYDALEAVKLYRPKNVIASWCTHIYNPKEHWREGNMYGIDELKILKKIDKYIHIGNENVHNKKPILSLPHRTIKSNFIVSRGLEKDKNVIWIWDNMVKK